MLLPIPCCLCFRLGIRHRRISGEHAVSGVAGTADHEGIFYLKGRWLGGALDLTMAYRVAICLLQEHHRQTPVRGVHTSHAAQLLASCLLLIEAL